jgi:hypothetical protein
MVLASAARLVMRRRLGSGLQLAQLVKLERQRRFALAAT